MNCTPAPSAPAPPPPATPLRWECGAAQSRYPSRRPSLATCSKGSYIKYVRGQKKSGSFTHPFSSVSFSTVYVLSFQEGSSTIFILLHHPLSPPSCGRPLWMVPYPSMKTQPTLDNEPSCLMSPRVTGSSGPYQRKVSSMTLSLFRVRWGNFVKESAARRIRDEMKVHCMQRGRGSI